jgi:hypothetical protein
VKTKIFYIPTLIILLAEISCKDDPPIVPPPPPVIKDTITVTVEYVTHSSIVLNIKSTMNYLASSINLFRIFNNDPELVISEYPITANDTSIIDDNFGNGLELNSTYTYYAVRIDTTGERKDSSNFITAITLAATNFNYTWQELAFGSIQYGPNVLYDVWGSDENNVWAVGGFYDDNNNNFGALHYNGNEWTPDSTVGGVAVHGFEWNDIWVVGGGVFYFNGIEWKQVDSYTSGGQSIPLDTVLFNNLPYASVWGTNSSNVYLGNERGKIVHWDGSKASIVFSYQSSVQVMDLDGYSANFIIGVGIGFTPPLLAIYYNGNSWNEMPIQNDPALYSVAILTPNCVYFAGSGIYNLTNDNFSRIFTSGYFMYDIEYNKNNGVTVAAGPFDGIYINNGLEWRDLRGQISNDNSTYLGIFLINNTIFCVGRNDNQAKIIIGKN